MKLNRVALECFWGSADAAQAVSALLDRIGRDWLCRDQRKQTELICKRNPGRSPLLEQGTVQGREGTRSVGEGIL
jgi:hypothetical protein